MIKRKYLVASIDASREKEQPMRGRSSPISLHSRTNSPACFTTSSASASGSSSESLWQRLAISILALARGSEYCAIVVVLLRVEETVNLAIGLESDHQGSEVVVALHFALAETTEAGPHDHGTGAAPLEELLHRLLVTLPRGAVVVGDLVVGLASAPGGGSGGGGTGMGAIGGWTGPRSGAMGGVGAVGHNFF
ncbi:hypothetical protein BDA96_10G265000 [Sorghum bicolor]|uniref:Uncharacterized protein n=1 Tax=Sorghum bicolor TaxID=4558 RepID=A0A921Q6M2_SORBI|nr:hypothetical protein BDA96_10G265000 [Sorghum bicolor]